MFYLVSFLKQLTHTQIFFNFLVKQFLQIHSTILFPVNVCQINCILLTEIAEHQTPNHDIRLNKQAL